MTTPDPERPVYLLVCRQCRKVTPCSSEDVIGFMEDGWPNCCGLVMDAFVPTEKPTGPPKGKKS